MVDSNRLPFLHQFKPFCILIIHGTIFHQSRIGFYIRIKEEFIPAICACLWHHAFCQCYDIATCRTIADCFDNCIVNTFFDICLLILRYRNSRIWKYDDCLHTTLIKQHIKTGKSFLHCFYILDRHFRLFQQIQSALPHQLCRVHKATVIADVHAFFESIPDLTHLLP